MFSDIYTQIARFLSKGDLKYFNSIELEDRFLKSVVRSFNFSSIKLMFSSYKPHLKTLKDLWQTRSVGFVFVVLVKCIMAIRNLLREFIFGLLTASELRGLKESKF